MKKKIIIIISVVILAILVRFAISSAAAYLKNKAAAKKTPPSVVVETVKDSEVIQNFEVPGRVVSKYQVSVMARISGYLQKSFFKEGDYVKTGDTLFLIEPVEYQNAANVAGANIQNIKAQLNYANKQLERAQELLRQDYISKSRYDEILANRDALQAQLNAANSNYSDTNRNLNYTQIKAPVDGRIGIIDVTVGNYVTPSTGSLTTINSTNPIYVTFSIPSDDYTTLSGIDTGNNKKRRVELYFRNGMKYEHDGIQDFQDNKIDQSTGTVALRATFQNPDNRLLHGEFVTVKLFANNKVKVPLVPISAVQENQEGKFIYKLNDDNLPELVYIKVQGQYGDNWIIRDGVKNGDKIITEGIQKVIPGNAVNIVSKAELNKKK